MLLFEGETATETIMETNGNPSVAQMLHFTGSYLLKQLMCS